ncbi:unnamed protein product [Eruca vesicaria subsp. sativa]|uniref:Uncharacterized protein n=1 Tax=Eruca vesicaria subsp. sativa TaxID=29727 RepID=A0ABC8KUU1_ERUVS|nr:unnamed protein product [Eruca vesicaria subsp. sativa]
MSATSIASRSRSLGSILRTATRGSLISPRPRISSPNNPNSSSPPLRQTRIDASSTPRLMLRRELSTHQPFHSVIAAACLVSKLPSDVTSFEGRFVNYVSPI